VLLKAQHERSSHLGLIGPGVARIAGPRRDPAHHAFCSQIGIPEAGLLQVVVAFALFRGAKGDLLDLHEVCVVAHDELDMREDRLVLEREVFTLDGQELSVGDQVAIPCPRLHGRVGGGDVLDRAVFAGNAHGVPDVDGPAV